MFETSTGHKPKAAFDVVEHLLVDVIWLLNASLRSSIIIIMGMQQMISKGNHSRSNDPQAHIRKVQHYLRPSKSSAVDHR